MQLQQRRSVQPASDIMQRHATTDDDEDEEEELLSEEDLSIENYMRRHPCILDRGQSFLDRHPWLYTLVPPVWTLVGITLSLIVGARMELSAMEMVMASVAGLIDIGLFIRVATRPAAAAPTHLCRDGQSIISLLHAMPQSSRAELGLGLPSLHLGVHAAELSRSWNFCDECRGFRPARSHHCSTCGTCVLMKDHHCVWIQQCVGASNMRMFFFYLSFTFVLALYAMMMNIAFLMHPSRSLLLFLLHCFIVLCGLVATAFLSVRCMLSFMRNETAVEAWIKIQHDKKRREEKQQQQQRLHQQQQQSQMQRRKEDGHGEVMMRPTVMRKEHMLNYPDGNTRRQQQQQTIQQDDVNDSAQAPIYFTPFRCSCHTRKHSAPSSSMTGSTSATASSYCYRFSYPSLQHSLTPIPDVPRYTQFDSGQLRVNLFLFWQDIRYSLALAEWINDSNSNSGIEIGNNKKERKDNRLQFAVTGPSGTSTPAPQNPSPSPHSQQLRPLLSTVADSFLQSKFSVHGHPQQLQQQEELHFLDLPHPPPEPELVPPADTDSGSVGPLRV